MIWRIRRIRMITLITNSGRKIICEGVMKGRQFDVLHIYTHAITPIEAYSIFENPDESSTLIVEETTEEEPIIRMYRGYTNVFSVSQATLYVQPGEIRIWLQKPYDPNDEVIVNGS